MKKKSDFRQFFLQSQVPRLRQYEALRAYFVDGEKEETIAKRFGYALSYFRKIKKLHLKAMETGDNPYFPKRKTGPKQRSTPAVVKQAVIALRKKNQSVLDIKSHLAAHNIKLSITAIDSMLKEDGFAPLPRRTNRERAENRLSEKTINTICQHLKAQEEKA